MILETFSHDNVTEKTFEMAAELKRIGASNSKVVRELFQYKIFTSYKAFRDSYV